MFPIGAWTGALGVTCGWCSSFEKSIYDLFSRDVDCSSVSLILMNMGRKYCGSSGIRVHRKMYCANSGFNPIKTKRRPLYLKTQFVPRCKHFSSRLQNQSVYDVSGTSRCLF